MRFRTFKQETTARTYRNYWQYAGRPASWDYETDLTKTSSVDHMLDVVTPGFSTKRNNGDIICSPMLKEKLEHTINNTVFDVSGVSWGVPVQYGGHTPALLQVVPVNPHLSENGGDMALFMKEFDREVSLSITRAHADVNASEMSLLATLGELPETIRWIQSILKRIIGLTKAFKDKVTLLRLAKNVFTDAGSLGKQFHLSKLEDFIKVQKLRAAKRTKSGATGLDLLDLWLEWRYALRPLIFDIRNALAAIGKKITSQRMVARGREIQLGKGKTSVHQPPNPDGNSIELWGTIDVEEKIAARAGCLYVLDDHITSIFDILGLDQPLEALWDLTPLSFILDWAFSIGDLLESWFKSSGLSILTSWVTLKVERIETRKITSAVMHGDPYTTWSGQQFELGSSRSEVSWKWRVPNPPLPLLPRLDLKLDLAKILDLGAIGRKTIGGRVPEVALRS